MRRGTAIAAIVALFLVGVLIGVLGTHAFYLHELHQPGGLAAFGTRMMAKDLKRRLDLNSRQQAEVARILASASVESAEMRREMTPRLLNLFDRVHDHINAVLTPAQRLEFERYRHRHRMWFRHFFAG
jgi:hypothetical protein